MSNEQRAMNKTKFKGGDPVDLAEAQGSQAAKTATRNYLSSCGATHSAVWLLIQSALCAL
jgi:hypothetical protein